MQKYSVFRWDKNLRHTVQIFKCILDIHLMLLGKSDALFLKKILQIDVYIGSPITYKECTAKLLETK